VHAPAPVNQDSHVKLVVALSAFALLLFGIAAWVLITRTGIDPNDPRLFEVKRQQFLQVLRRPGLLQPVSSQLVFSKIRGTLLWLVPDGTRVKKGDTLFQMDPLPHQEALDNQVNKIRSMNADWEKQRETLAKALRQAKSDLVSRELNLKLEQLRLKELEQGPTDSDEEKAKDDLANAKNLLDAKRDEHQILAELAEGGYVSSGEVRQKALEVVAQEQKVADADIAYRKLHIPDPVKIGDQKLKVNDQDKNLTSAREKVRLQEEDFKRAQENFDARLKREEQVRKDFATNLENTRVTAPLDGLVVVSKNPWRGALTPGMDVWQNLELARISNSDRMMVTMTLDEGRLIGVKKDLKVNVLAPGEGSKARFAKMTSVAERSRDEFDDFRQETKDIVGMATRQVVDLQAELDGDAVGLRAGSRVQAEIVLSDLPNQLVVPRAAIVRETDAPPFVRVLSGSGYRRCQIKINGDDGLFSAIEALPDDKDGLKDGERIWMVEP